MSGIAVKNISKKKKKKNYVARKKNKSRKNVSPIIYELIEELISNVIDQEFMYEVEMRSIFNLKTKKKTIPRNDLDDKEKNYLECKRQSEKRLQKALDIIFVSDLWKLSEKKGRRGINEDDLIKEIISENRKHKTSIRSLVTKHFGVDDSDDEFEKIYERVQKKKADFKYYAPAEDIRNHAKLLIDSEGLDDIYRDELRFIQKWIQKYAPLLVKVNCKN